MISDVLAEFVEGIDHYLSSPTFDRVYTGSVRVLAKLLREGAEELRQELDRTDREGKDLLHPHGVLPALMEEWSVGRWDHLFPKEARQ